MVHVKSDSCVAETSRPLRQKGAIYHETRAMRVLINCLGTSTSRQISPPCSLTTLGVMDSSLSALHSEQSERYFQEVPYSYRSHGPLLD